MNSQVSKFTNRSVFFSGLAGLLTLVFLVSGLPSSARTLSVPESSPTIKGALIKAQTGDIILVSCGTYYEHDIMIPPGVALWSGTLQPNCVTIDAQGKGRVFTFADADTNTALVGFTLRGATTTGNGGAILLRNSSPRISNCIFQDNSARNGGAMAIDKASFPVVSNCLFQNNSAVKMGGGVHSVGKATFLHCAYENNQALLGAGLALTQSADVALTGCSFKRNSAGNTGGGLEVQKSRCVVFNCVFADNLGGLGGSVLSTRDSEVLFRRNTLYHNATDTGGGVMAILGRKPEVVNSIIAFNQAFVLRPDSTTPSFQGCNLFGNEGGDWIAELRPLGNKSHNISRDPHFCAPEFGNFSLKNTSSCLPGNNPSGNQTIVGAMGPGCSTAENNRVAPSPTAAGFKAINAGL